MTLVTKTGKTKYELNLLTYSEARFIKVNGLDNSCLANSKFQNSQTYYIANQLVKGDKYNRTKNIHYEK